MIIDASIAFRWIFVEEGSDAATALIGRDDLRAPSFLLAEIGNAMWKKSRLGELGDRDAYSAQVALVGSLIELVDEALDIPRALEIAIKLNHAIYDCIYLALAERLDETLMTGDAKFAAKVRTSAFAPLLKLH